MSPNTRKKSKSETKELHSAIQRHNINFFDLFYGYDTWVFLSDDRVEQTEKICTPEISWGTKWGTR